MPSGIKRTHEQFVEEVYKLVGDAYSVLGQYKDNKTKILVRHNECGHEYEVTPNNFLRGCRCPSCAKIKFKNSRRRSHEDFVNKIFELVGNEYEILGTYKNAHTKIKMKHNKCGFEFDMTPNHFIHGNRCPYCQKAVRKTTAYFRQEVKSIDDSYEVIGEYKKAIEKILMKHNKCGSEFEMRPNDFLNGQRCPKCARDEQVKKMTKSHDKYVKEVKELVGDEYSVVGKYVTTHTKILMKHNVCNREFEVMPSNFLRGTRCPHCHEKRGEKTISEFLDSLNITYKPQYKFDDCKNVRPLPFDFAIFDKNNNLIALIEYQGQQHYEPIKHFGGEEGFKYRKTNDQIKKQYCQANNIKLIEIPYWEFDNIENILLQHLNTKKPISV